MTHATTKSGGMCFWLFLTSRHSPKRSAYSAKFCFLPPHVTRRMPPHTHEPWGYRVKIWSNSSGLGKTVGHHPGCSNGGRGHEQGRRHSGTRHCGPNEGVPCAQSVSP